MLMQVLSMTPEQIAAMPPTEQETIRMLVCIPALL
jgi:hypothetical protein